MIQYLLFQVEGKMMQEYESTDDFFVKRKMVASRKRLCFGIIVAIIFGFIVGILIGRFGTCPEEKPKERKGAVLDGVDQAIIQDGDSSIGDIIMNEINSDNIREYLR